MNIKDILNADLPTVLQWARRGFSWWIEELSQSLPKTWRERLLNSQPDVIVEFGDEDARFLRKDGGPVDPATLSRRQRTHVRVAVPARRVLTRLLEFPLLPMSDIRRMLSLEIDRLTPFRAGSVHFDVELIRRDADRSRQQVLLGVLPASTATDLMARATKLGVTPAAFGAKMGTSSDIHFDFLSSLKGSNSALRTRSRLPYWWAGVAALLLLNLAAISYRDSVRLEALQQIVDSQAGPVAVAMRLRASVEAEAARRTTLINRIQKLSPLPILDAVSKALPSNAWTQTFEWNGQTAHLVGYSNGPADILRTLESSPSLHNARVMSRDAIPVKQGGMQPFDVAVDSGKRTIR